MSDPSEPVEVTSGRVPLGMKAAWRYRRTLGFYTGLLGDITSPPWAPVSKVGEPSGFLQGLCEARRSMEGHWCPLWGLQTFCGGTPVSPVGALGQGSTPYPLL